MHCPAPCTTIDQNQWQDASDWSYSRMQEVSHCNVGSSSSGEEATRTIQIGASNIHFCTEHHLQPGDVNDEQVQQQLAWASFRLGDIALDSSCYVNVVNQIYPAGVIHASCEPTYDGDPVTIERMGPHLQTDVVRQSVVLAPQDCSS